MILVSTSLGSTFCGHPGPYDYNAPPVSDRASKKDTESAPQAEQDWSAVGRPLVHVVVAGLVGAILGSLDGVLATGASDLAQLPEGARGAAIGLSLALILPVALFAGALAGGFAFTLSRLTTAASMTALLSKTWARAAIAAGGAGIGAGFAFILGRKEIEWVAVDWTLPVMLLLGGGAYLGGVWLLRRARLVPLAIALVVLVGAFAAGVLAWSAGGDARTDALTRLSEETALAKRVLRRTVPLFDRDGDGFPTALCAAGCDCNDADPAINPGAEDLAANGVDEDCSGEDATLEAEAEYAAVFAKPGQTTKPTTSEASAGPAKPIAKPATVRKPAVKTLALPGPTESPMAGILPVVPGGHTPPEGDAKAKKPKAPEPPKPKPEGTPKADTATKKDSRPAKKPNVLMITVDTLRADHLGTYGYSRNTSPNIDAWAKTGVVFEQARTTGPSTRFSVAPTLLSKWFTEVKRGKYEWPVLSQEETFLAERLKALGYLNGAFHSIRYFRKQYGFTQGFQHYSVDALDKRGPPLKMISSDFITDEVLEYFDTTLSKSDDPWFVWAYYGDPHSAYMQHKSVPRFGPLYKDTYDGEIAFVDQHVGRLFAGLKKRGQWDNTVVLLWSDHGEGLDKKEDHGALYHSKNLYDELIRVPFIMTGPGIKPGRVKTPVSMIDLTPTLMDWLRQDLDPAFRGVSLAPFLVGESPPHPPTFSEKHRKKDNPMKAMVMWPYKLHVHFPQMHVEIYNLEEDPKERRNLARTIDPAIKKRLMGVFRHWLTKVLQPQEPNYRH